MFFDTHCHPQFPQYDNDRAEVIRRAFDAGVQMICVGTDYEMSQRAIELAKNHDGIWASVGLHPNDNLHEAFDPELYYQLGLDKKVAAFGEIGLDYYRTRKSDQQTIQKKRFFQQLQVASELNLPLIIHCRDAHADMIKTLSVNLPTLEAGGVIHSFTGTWQDAKRYFDLGFYIGLNGIITFARQYDETAVNAPLDRILLETDAPYLTPEPHRGKRNEPAYMQYIAQKIAELRKIPVQEVAEITTENARKLFGLKSR